MGSSSFGLSTALCQCLWGTHVQSLVALMAHGALNESLNRSQDILLLKAEEQRRFHRINKTFRMLLFKRFLTEKTALSRLNIKFPHEGSLLRDLNCTGLLKI